MRPIVVDDNGQNTDKSLADILLEQSKEAARKKESVITNMVNNAMETIRPQLNSRALDGFYDAVIRAKILYDARYDLTYYLRSQGLTVTHDSYDGPKGEYMAKVSWDKPTKR